MNGEITKTIQKIEDNIKRSDILNKLLSDIHNSNTIKDYSYFYNKGYNSDEINLGERLIELYLMLKKYVDKVND